MDSRFRYDPFRRLYVFEKKSNSYGEKKIIKYLDIWKTIYSREVLMIGCKYINHLKFDFKICVNNITFLLEYDGKQHFNSNKKSGGKEFFKIIKNKDKIKRNWCENNNIKLFRIRYDQYNQIKILLELTLAQIQDPLFYNKKRCAHCGFIINKYHILKSKLCKGCYKCFIIK